MTAVRKRRSDRPSSVTGAGLDVLEAKRRATEDGLPVVVVVESADQPIESRSSGRRSIPPIVLVSSAILGALAAGAATAASPAMGVLVAAAVVYAFIVLERPWMGVLALAAFATAASGLGRGLPVPELKFAEVLVIATSALVMAGVWGPKLDVVDYSALGYVAVTGVMSIAHPLLRGDPLALDHLQTAFGPALFFLMYRTARVVPMTMRQRAIVLGAMVGASLISVVVGFGQRFDVPGVRRFVATATDGGIFQNWTYLNTPKGARATGLFEIWHSFAGYLLPLLLLCVGAAVNPNVDRRMRRASGVVAAALSSGLLISQSLTVLAILPFAALAVAFLNGDRLRSVLLVLLLVSAAFLFAGSALTERVAEQFDPASGTVLGSNLDARLRIWNEDYSGPLGRYWAFGYGPGIPPEVTWGHTESLYLTLLLRGGVILLAAFAIFYYTVAVAAYRRMRTNVGLERVLSSVVFVLIPTSAFVSLIWPYFTSSGFPQVFWILLGLMCAPIASDRVRRKRTPPMDPTPDSGRGLAASPGDDSTTPAARAADSAVPAEVAGEPTSRDLTSQSIAGALWFLVQTIVIKASGFVFQIALAYLLVPEDFGAIGLALSVTALADVLHQNGLAQVVVQRKENIETSGPSVFWLSMMLGLGAMAVLIAVARPLETLFGTPGLAQLIMVISVAVPINAANVVPRSDLIARLHFSRTATISGFQFVLQGALSVVLAFLGFGALSFAIPVPLAALVAVVLYARHRSLNIAWPPVRSSWKPLFRDTSVLVATSWLVKIVDFGDYFLLGLFTDAATVGLYYFAFRLSAQSATIVAQNVGRVMFPALVQVSGGPERQALAFERASRALAGVGIPLAVLLLFFGADVVYSVFDPEWQGAAAYVQVLSVAAAIRAVSESHTHVLRAQGRFRDMFRWNVVGTTTFLMAVSLGGALAGADGLVVAVVAHSSIDGWVRYYLTTRPMGGALSHFPMLIAGPFVSASIVCAGALGAARYGLGLAGPGAARLLMGATAMALLYLPVLRLVDPKTTRVLQRVIRQATRPVRRRLAARTERAEEVSG